MAFMVTVDIPAITADITVAARITPITAAAVPMAAAIRPITALLAATMAAGPGGFGLITAGSGTGSAPNPYLYEAL